MTLLTLIHFQILSGTLNILNLFWSQFNNDDVTYLYAKRLFWTYILIIYLAGVWVEDLVMSVMFITAQRQLWSENLRVAEGNPFTKLPKSFSVGCLIQDIDSTTLV